MESTKDLNYYKNNCEEDYINTPISVLRYITELEQALQLQQTGVIRSSGNYCRSCNSKNISIDVSCEPNELICDDCWSLDISTENNS